jgi:hypothetical protein
LSSAGVDLKVAQVSGDNLFPLRDQLQASDQELIFIPDPGSSNQSPIHNLQISFFLLANLLVQLVGFCYFHFRHTY